MQVILMKDVESLGDSGEVIQVSDGYARNYLFPQKLAIAGTEGALKDLQRRRARIQARAEKKHQEDLEKAAQIEALESIILQANSGEGGKLFGAITTKELAAIIKEKTGLTVERKNISLDHPIHRLGEYNLAIRFSAKVTGTLKIHVVPIKTGQALADEVSA